MEENQEITQEAPVQAVEQVVEQAPVEVVETIQEVVEQAPTTVSFTVNMKPDRIQINHVVYENGQTYTVDPETAAFLTEIVSRNQ